MENTEIKETPKPLNLYQKLLEIQRKVNGLSKDKDTKSQYNPNGYKYVTGDKVLGHVKPLMNEYGLLLKQEILDIQNQRQDYQVKNGQKSEILSKVMMRFTWIDCETGEKDENLFGANGQNDWEKGLGSALTYAERYFLLKYFHIATDDDDVDNPDRRTSEPVLQKVAAPPVLIAPPAPITPLETISDEWVRAISIIGDKDLVSANTVLEGLKKDNANKPTKSYLMKVCKDRGMAFNTSSNLFEISK